MTAPELFVIGAFKFARALSFRRSLICALALLAGGRPSRVVAYKKQRTSGNPALPAGAFVEHEPAQFSLLAHLYGSQSGQQTDRTPAPMDVPPPPDRDKKHSLGTVLVQPGEEASLALDRELLGRAICHVLKDMGRRRETVVGPRNQTRWRVMGRKEYYIDRSFRRI
jgi:hypothetical protein